MKKFIFAVLIGLLSVNVQANENKALIDILVTAKTTGMCGTLKQLTAFQESTKMEGGDEFIMRFINTEAARLGKNIPDFLKLCEESVAIYTRTMKSLDYEK